MSYVEYYAYFGAMKKEARGHIGIFDSGIGGLSVWRELRRLLPDVPITYLADQQFCPYGEKSDAAIQERSRQITSHLLYEHHCQLVIVACNTATAAAIDDLRSHFPTTPIIGMEPAVKPAALRTQTGNVGLLATAGTLRGRLFRETRERFASHITLHTQIGHGLVELVETGKADSPEAEVILKHYLKPMLAANIDHLVLGCTHYPFLEPVLQKLMPASVRILNPADAVARQVLRKFERRQLQKGTPTDLFLTTLPSGSSALHRMVTHYLPQDNQTARFSSVSLNQTKKKTSHPTNNTPTK